MSTCDGSPTNAKEGYHLRKLEDGHTAAYNAEVVLGRARLKCKDTAFWRTPCDSRSAGNCMYTNLKRHERFQEAIGSP